VRDPVVMGGLTGEVLAIADASMLTPVERDRAERFERERDRLDFTAAHLLVRLCAARVLGLPPVAVTLLQHCDQCGPGHGRPYLAEAPGLGVSLSHTRGYVCAAVGRGRVGVDAEHVPGGALDTMLAEQVLTPAERSRVLGNRDLIRQWVRKEALIKRGELTLAELGETDLSGLPPTEPDGPRSFIWRGRHVLEWSERGDVLVAVVTDQPARLAPLEPRAASPPGTALRHGQELGHKLRQGHRQGGGRSATATTEDRP
jgi:4'-phosphopantetheinyl transferase